jgi:hypothetical protein
MAIATPAVGCDDSPDLPILPGESRAAFEERYNYAWKALRAIERYKTQRTMLTKAHAVYVGRILASEALPGDITGSLHRVQVEPMQSIKGALPRKSQWLTDTPRTACGLMNDGAATEGGRGDWVIVFHGVEKSAWRPRGIYSILSQDAFADELVAGLWKVGTKSDD